MFFQCIAWHIVKGFLLLFVFYKKKLSKGYILNLQEKKSKEKQTFYGRTTVNMSKRVEL